jgi:hypothetical protein
MRKWRVVSLVLLLGGGVLSLFLHRLPLASSPSLLSVAASMATPATLEYQHDSLPQAEVYTLVIPLSRRPVPAIAPSLATVTQFAEQQGAVAVLNAGFFDPQNQKSTSYVTLNGQQVADPRQNERLMENPNLSPYLDRVLNRTELRRYDCDGENRDGENRDGKNRFDLARHLDQPPENCRVVDAIGAGPQLLPELTLEQEGFYDTANGTVIRDPLGSNQPNARTAVGLMGDKMVWVMVAQKSDGAGGITGGMTLGEVAEWMRQLGVEKAMNLDGGSSSALYYDGRAFYGKGDGQARPVKSVLVVK